MSVVMMDSSEELGGSEMQQMIGLLEYRYGDGMVYLPKTKPYRLLALALVKGLIDSEGYLTRKGRVLLAHHSS